jgi:hypothetical protein
MKLSSIAFASVVALAAIAFAAGGALAAVNYNSSKSNTGNMTAQPTTTCPTGETWNATTKKCVLPTATPLNNRQNVSGAAQPSSTNAATPSPK